MPGVVAVLSGARHGVKAPEHLPGPGVEAPDVPARPAGSAVAHEAARDEYVAADPDGRGQPVLRIREAVGHACAHIDPPALAERGIGSSRVRVDAPQPALDVAEVDEPPLPIAPRGHATVHIEIAGHGFVDARVEHPPLGPRLGVEGEETAERRRDVEDAVDGERRRLEGRARGQGRPVAPVPRIECPGDLEAGDVPPVDLVERRMLGAPGVASDVRPVPARGGAAEYGRTEQERRQGNVRAHVHLEESPRTLWRGLPARQACPVPVRTDPSVAFGPRGLGYSLPVFKTRARLFALLALAAVAAVNAAGLMGIRVARRGASRRRHASSAASRRPGPGHWRAGSPPPAPTSRSWRARRRCSSCARERGTATSPSGGRPPSRPCCSSCARTPKSCASP